MTKPFACLFWATHRPKIKPLTGPKLGCLLALDLAIRLLATGCSPTQDWAVRRPATWPLCQPQIGPLACQQTGRHSSAFGLLARPPAPTNRTCLPIQPGTLCYKFTLKWYIFLAWCLLYLTLGQNLALNMKYFWIFCLWNINFLQMKQI
jgi:hypothetical protein